MARPLAVISLSCGLDFLAYHENAFYEFSMGLKISEI